MEDVARAREMAAVGGTRTRDLVERLRQLEETDLLDPSHLEGWSRLTIVCHLRYGTSAMLRITQQTLAGEEAAYYPEGRASQRPLTLEPSPGERPQDIVGSFSAAALELDALWGALGESQWNTLIREPPDNPDLGAIPLARLALARLVEVDVHGTDLDVGSPDWSATLVEVALPTRLRWLNTRRTNHRDFDRSIKGSWLLVPLEGRSWLVTVDGERVESRQAGPGTETPTATLQGSARDLLALLLGRPTSAPLLVTGDEAFGASFSKAFPGP